MAFDERGLAGIWLVLGTGRFPGADLTPDSCVEVDRGAVKPEGAALIRGAEVDRGFPFRFGVWPVLGVKLPCVVLLRVVLFSAGILAVELLVAEFP